MFLLCMVRDSEDIIHDAPVPYIANVGICHEILHSMERSKVGRNKSKYQSGSQ